jgi:CheY-like chemotaxis protein
MRILVAEDEDNIALAYAFALKGRGHQVKITSNGRECVEEYLKNSTSGKTDLTKDRPPFDIVIMDYRMPEMDGLEAAGEILKIRPDQRIIFASAYARDTLVEAIHQLHFVAELLQKPFDLRALIKAIEDTDLASQLQFLNEKIRNQSWAVTPKQISDLADAMLIKRCQDGSEKDFLWEK